MRLYDVEDTAQTLNIDDPQKATQYEDFNVWVKCMVRNGEIDIST
jgi:hypothetical protein